MSATTYLALVSTTKGTEIIHKRHKIIDNVRIFLIIIPPEPHSRCRLQDSPQEKHFPEHLKKQQPRKSSVSARILNKIKNQEVYERKMLEALLNMDGGVLLLIQEYVRTPLLNKIVIFITTLGNGGMIWIAATLLLMIPKKTRNQLQ